MTSLVKVFILSCDFTKICIELVFEKKRKKRKKKQCAKVQRLTCMPSECFIMQSDEAALADSAQPQAQNGTGPRPQGTAPA
jgi:hypothetical protein